MSDVLENVQEIPAGTVLPAGSILIEPEEKLEPFAVANIPDPIRSAMGEMGWSGLMPVQSNALPYLVAGRDMIVQSRTGSGKTGAFLIPLIMNLDPEKDHAQALVLVPTRELAGQVYAEFLALSKNLGTRGALVYGGVGYGKQFDDLNNGAQVIIGTPGRVLDHINRRSMKLENLKTLVFDEADEMLSMGFFPDMMELRRHVPRNRSTWMFSATMPYKVQMLAEEFLRKPEFLSLSAGNVAVSAMEHRFCAMPEMDKDQALMRMFEMENPDSAIVFCNMKSDVEYVVNVVKNRGYNADQISGDLSQKDREKVMAKIRNREIRFLVATDIAARGIDISDLSHVFMYDIPKDPELYVHRAGRTARAGNTGVAITLVSNMSDKTMLKKISRKYGIEFVERNTPTEEDVQERIAERLLVMLEDRYRSLTAAEKKRIARMQPLVESLYKEEDERALLAMLLEDLYAESFKARQSPPKQESTAPRKDDPERRGDQAQGDKKKKKRPPSRGKREGGGRSR